MKFVPAAVTRQIASRALELEKNSPTILFGAGLAGVVVSHILACRATLKVQDVLEESEDRLNATHAAKLSGTDVGKTNVKIYAQTSVKIGTLYAPTVIVGGAGIAALVSSHNILNRRNAALTAAYAAIDQGFKEYRRRVVEKYGEDEDRELRYGTRDAKIIDEKTGEVEAVKMVADRIPSVYARFFDPLCKDWSKEPEYNLLFLRCQQNYANDLLRSRGHVFLNEVYDMLGLERSKAGSVVGWVLGSRQDRDNFIDFGVFVDEHNARDFVNGREGSILLDFNVDGVIWDLIEPSQPTSWQAGHSYKDTDSVQWNGQTLRQIK